MKTTLFLIFLFFGISAISFIYAEDLYTFQIDEHNIITNSPDVYTIDIDWDSEHLPELSVNFTKPYTGQFQIQIPKSMPRTMNLDFETTLMMDLSSLSGAEQEKDWDEHITEKDFKMIDDRISETESLCYYVISVELSKADYFKIVTGSVASGRWEEVTIQSEECNDVYDQGLFLNPIAVTVDSKGFVYVVDHNAFNVQKFDGNGKFISQWESEDKHNTMFSYPYGIAIDSEDNVYVVDQYRGKIKKLAGGGTIAKSFGHLAHAIGNPDPNQTYADGEFSLPSHIAIDSNDNFYVVDFDGFMILKFSNDGKFLLKWRPSGPETLSSPPHGIAIDSMDNIYLLHYGATLTERYSKVLKFAPDGTYLSQWGSFGTDDGKFQSPSGIAIDSSDMVYVTDFDGQYIQKFSSDGKFIEKFLVQPIIEGSFSGISSIAIDDNTGEFYVTNSMNKQVSKFAPDGMFILSWGGEDTHDVSENIIKILEEPEPENGIYTKSRMSTQLLELGKEVDIVFVIKENMIGDTTKAVTKYQILKTQDEPFDTNDTSEFRFDSLNSNEISVSFSPKEFGAFFLKQDIEYSHDNGVSSAGSLSTLPFHVVEKFNKNTNEDGLCIKSGMVSLFKPDFSTNVCVTPETAMKLMNRWYR